MAFPLKLPLFFVLVAVVFGFLQSCVTGPSATGGSSHPADAHGELILSPNPAKIGREAMDHDAKIIVGIQKKVDLAKAAGQDDFDAYCRLFLQAFRARELYLYSGVTVTRGSRRATVTAAGIH